MLPNIGEIGRALVHDVNRKYARGAAHNCVFITSHVRIDMPDSPIIIVMNQPGGVTDYAQVVASQMGGPVRVLPFEENLQVDGADVLLHYSGYGYAKRGAPLHLLAWVRRNRPRMRRFGVFFHELYATGKPTSSAFWLSPAQRYIASRLARLSDFWITNIEDSEDWLLRHAGHLPHRRLAVASNIGELPTFNPDGRSAAVVFGSASLRAMTYEAGGDALFRWAGEQGIEIHDVGSPIDDPQLAESLRRHGVVTHGRQTTEAIQQIMAKASFGLLRYPPRFVAKSSVLAAYCTHGMVPMLLSDTHGVHDGLRAGEQYLHGVPAGAVPAPEIARIGRNAFDWYQDHSVGIHALATSALLAAS